MSIRPITAPLARCDTKPSPAVHGLCPFPRVLIVDDHLVVRAGFTSVLRSEFEVIRSEQGGAEALGALKRYSADVVLLDLRMPGMSGLHTLLELQRMSSPPPVIVLSAFEPDEEVCSAVELGAQGFLLKDSACDEIIAAVHMVCAGQTYLPEWVTSKRSERKLQSTLSPRELEILAMVAKGLTNKEIGHVIQVSHFTVRNHVRNIIAKMEVGDRTEAATVAIQTGILGTLHSFHSAA